MRYGLIISAVLHAAVVLLAVLGVLPSPSPVVMTAEPIPVDIVDIGELTNTRIDEKAPAPPKPAPAAPRAPEKPPAPPPPTAEARPDSPPPAPPKVPEPPTRVAEAAPPRQPEPPPMPKPPEPKPEPAKPEPKKPEPPKPEPKKPEPPKPEPKKPEPKKPEPKKPEPKKPEPKKPEPKKPEPKKPEPEKPDFQQMLKDLTKQPDKAPAKEPAKPEPQNRQVAEAEADSPSQADAPRLSDRLTVSQMDALRRQMSACWLVDPGLPNVREVSVEIRVRIARDRTVESAEIVDTARMRSDRTYRSVAESALRAVRNPRCNPLELPPDKYEVWRDAVFVFSPRDVL